MSLKSLFFISSGRAFIETGVACGVPAVSLLLFYLCVYDDSKSWVESRDKPPIGQAEGTRNRGPAQVTSGEWAILDSLK